MKDLPVIWKLEYEESQDPDDPQLWTPFVDELKHRLEAINPRFLIWHYRKYVGGAYIYAGERYFHTSGIQEFIQHTFLDEFSNASVSWNGGYLTVETFLEHTAEHQYVYVWPMKYSREELDSAVDYLEEALYYWQWVSDHADEAGSHQWKWMYQQMVDNMEVCWSEITQSDMLLLLNSEKNMERKFKMLFKEFFKNYEDLQHAETFGGFQWDRICSLVTAYIDKQKGQQPSWVNIEPKELQTKFGEYFGMGLQHFMNLAIGFNLVQFDKEIIRNGANGRIADRLRNFKHEATVLNDTVTVSYPCIDLIKTLIENY